MTNYMFPNSLCNKTYKTNVKWNILNSIKDFGPQGPVQILKNKKQKVNRKKVPAPSVWCHQGQMKVRIARIEESLDLIMEIMQSSNWVQYMTSRNSEQ